MCALIDPPEAATRCARLRISPAIPSVQGGACCDVVTLFTSVPRAGAETRTMSPDL